MHPYWYSAISFLGGLCIVFLGLSFLTQQSYKPVLIVHGVLTHYTSMNELANRIREIHPGTKVYVTNEFGGLWSLEPMWHQVRKIGDEFMRISAVHPEGFHVIGYSQGGLISRAILETYPDHNVQTFISLSAPQAGEYGTNFLHIVYPDLALKTAYKMFYSRMGQLTSVGNYWNDPYHQSLYYEHNRFLPYINNEIEDFNRNSFKEGIVKLEKMVLIGGPDDGIIEPWESSYFGYYNDRAEVVEMRDRNIYKLDLFGLKTLDDAGKLDIHKISGIQHYDWHKNLTFIDDYILPYLT